MSNEELVTLIQAGDRGKLLELWAGVRNMVWKYAKRWADQRVEAEDLVQAGFIAVLRAVDGYDSTAGTKFTTYLDYFIKQEFNIAAGQRTKRERLDPLQDAHSLDMPLTDSEGDSFTLADTLPDPAAEPALQAVVDRDFEERRHDAVEAAIATLPENQQSIIQHRYYDQQPLPRGQGSYQAATAHAKALRTLRHPSRSRALLAYW